MEMNHGMEKLCGICYKICMMSVPILGASYLYGNNMLVIHNT